MGAKHMSLMQNSPSHHADVARQFRAVKARRPDWELSCFEIDRFTFISLLQDLRRELKAGSKEMKMWADERAFGDSLSQTIRLVAPKLDLVAKELNSLLPSIAGAGIPVLSEQLHRRRPTGRGRGR